MIRISLPAAELQQVQQLFRSTDDRTLRDRLQIIFMVQRGRPHQQIAGDLGITPCTVGEPGFEEEEAKEDRLRPRHYPTHRPTVTQRLPGAWRRRPAPT